MGALICVTVSTLALAAPPPDKGGGGKGGGNGGTDPTATFQPEFGGVRIGGRNKTDQFILKNRDGSIEVVAHEAPSIQAIDLSPDSAALIAYFNDNAIYLQSWSADPTFTVSSVDLAYANPRGLGPPSFSPDGKRMAFLEIAENNKVVVSVCDIDPVDRDCATVSSDSVFTQWKLNYVHFHPDSNNHVVISAKELGVVDDRVYVHELGSGSAPSGPLNHEVTGFDDVGPSHGNSPPLLVTNTAGVPRFFSLEDGSEQFRSFSGVGYGYRFNCSSDAVLYLETGSGGPTLSVAQLDGASEKLGGKGWNINRGHDWIHKTDCP